MGLTRESKIKLDSKVVGKVESATLLLPIDELSKTEQELYDLLVKNGGTLTYLVELANNHKLMGAVGKLVSHHIAKIERDFTEPRKKYRKKLVLIK